MVSHLIVNEPIEAMAVYLERRKTRLFVGKLRYDKQSQQFHFRYDNKYLLAKNIIPLGPEFPLAKREFHSKELFPSLADRIPSRENPAYEEYCEITGIAADEVDPIKLLVSIGRKGPSSFIFEPVYVRAFDRKALKAFRLELGLTTYEFASCFEIQQSSLVKVEQGHLQGDELRKRIELCARFPEVARFQILRDGGVLFDSKRRELLKALKGSA